jgi:hypothetical protein
MRSASRDAYNNGVTIPMSDVLSNSLEFMDGLTLKFRGLCITMALSCRLTARHVQCGDRKKVMHQKWRGKCHVDCAYHPNSLLSSSGESVS